MEIVNHLSRCSSYERMVILEPFSGGKFCELCDKIILLMLQRSCEPIQVDCFSTIDGDLCTPSWTRIGMTNNPEFQKVIYFHGSFFYCLASCHKLLTHVFCGQNSRKPPIPNYQNLNLRGNQKNKTIQEILRSKVATLQGWCYTSHSNQMWSETGCKFSGIPEWLVTLA